MNEAYLVVQVKRRRSGARSTDDTRAVVRTPIDWLPMKRTSVMASSQTFRALRTCAQRLHGPGTSWVRVPMSAARDTSSHFQCESQVFRYKALVKLRTS